MPRAAGLLLVLALSPVVAFADDPCPVVPKAPDPVDTRIDAALAAPAAERAAHVQTLAADAPTSIARLLDRLAPPKAVPAEPAPPSGPVVNLEIRFLQATEAAVRGALATSDGLGGGVRVLEPAQAERLLDEIEASADVMQMRGAELTLFDRQRMTVEVLERLSYVSDFEVEVAQDAFIADPVVSTVVEGLQVEMRPVVSSDGKLVTLETDVSSMAVAKPLAVEERELRGTRVTIQRPETHTARVTRTITVPLGAHVLWGAPRPACADATAKPSWLLARATLADPSASDEVPRIEEPGSPEVIVPRTEGEAPPELPPPGGR